MVRTPEGNIELDTVGKINGRGVYVCKKLDCFKKARKAKRFETALECSIPEEVYERLTEELTVGN